MNEQPNNYTTVRTTNLESRARHALLGAQKITGLAAPCRIHIHSKRHRLTDPDGVCAKYVIDGLIHCGLLPDDSPHWIQSITFSQEKIASTQDEATVVTIEVEN